MTISPVDHVILLMWVKVLEDGEGVSEENIIKLASSEKRKHDQKAECTPHLLLLLLVQSKESSGEKLQTSSNCSDMKSASTESCC